MPTTRDIETHLPTVIMPLYECQWTHENRALANLIVDLQVGAMSDRELAILAHYIGYSHER